MHKASHQNVECFVFRAEAAALPSGRLTEIFWVRDELFRSVTDQVPTNVGGIGGFADGGSWGSVQSHNGGQGSGKCGLNVNGMTYPGLPSSMRTKLK